MSEDKKDGFLEMEMGKGLEPKIIDGFWVDFAKVIVEGTEGMPAQNISSLKHLRTGADCYVATEPETKKTDQELVDMGKVVLTNLVAESQSFAQLNSTNALGEIHKAVSNYQTANTPEELAAIRKSFKEVATKLPSIPENLNQIDLAATWDWQIQQNLRKPPEMIIDFKPLKDIDFKIEPGPILFPNSFKDTDNH